MGVKALRTFTIVTPIYNPDPEYLAAAYESVVSQELPEGWQLEWALQEDGSTGILGKLLPEHPRLSIGEGRRGGIALTRNLALGRSTGELVKNLDQDDILTPGVVARDIAVLTENPDVGWTTSRVLDLLPDGSTVGFDNDPPHGRLEPGVVLEHWRTHNFRLPVHPTTICIRRPLLTAVGGWMGVPGSDDTGMMIAASVLSTGFFHGEVGLLYRKHEAQETAGDFHYAPIEWTTRMNLISERADALKEMWEKRQAGAQ
jgi:glycosyltransferase involved in cell wall biosynthesis